MPAPTSSPPSVGTQPLWWLIAGAILVAAGWLLPVQVKSLTPLLLKEAGSSTPTLTDFARRLRDTDKPGPAAHAVATAKQLKLRDADPLVLSLEEEFARIPSAKRWGGTDAYLEQVFPPLKTPEPAAPATPAAAAPLPSITIGGKPAVSPATPASATSAAAPTAAAAEAKPAALLAEPALPNFLPAKARETVRGFLANSSSGTVRALLAHVKVDRASRFVPATRAGGQPLEATILMTALLQQGRWLSESLASEVRTMADQANRDGDLAAIEGFYFNLLVLARRLDWVTLGELLKVSPDTKTVADFAQLARMAPDKFSSLITAALIVHNARDAAAYALKFGSPGAVAIETALASGEGAVQQLLLRQVPVGADAPVALDFFATLSLRHPNVMTFVKFFCFLAGMWSVFRALDRALVGPMRAAANRAFVHARSGAISLVAAGLLFVLSEPFLLRGAPASDYEMRVSIPALNVIGQVQAAPSSAAAIDPSTIASIVFFGALQLFVYAICLFKIREIERRDLPPLTKLSLMNNEENLFDAGLYVGIAGTATALVLQVLGIIQSNLLAAYSSNLFGITCVAVVKIRHVRLFKNKLILEVEQQLAKPAAVATVAATSPAPAVVVTKPV